MKITVEVNEFQTSDGIEMDKINRDGLEKYREEGYYVLIPAEMSDNLLRKPYEKYLCYISKSNEKLTNKMVNMKGRGEWAMYSPQFRSD